MKPAPFFAEITGELIAGAPGLLDVSGPPSVTAPCAYREAASFLITQSLSNDGLLKPQSWIYIYIYIYVVYIYYIILYIYILLTTVGHVTSKFGNPNGHLYRIAKPFGQSNVPESFLGMSPCGKQTWQHASLRHVV